MELKGLVYWSSRTWYNVKFGNEIEGIQNIQFIRVKKQQEIIWDMIFKISSLIFMGTTNMLPQYTTKPVPGWSSHYSILVMICS